jgi:hypothetical protein
VSSLLNKTALSLSTIEKISFEELDKKIAEEDDITKFYVLIIARALKQVLERQKQVKGYKEMLEIDFWITLLTSALETWSKELEKKGGD